MKIAGIIAAGGSSQRFGRDKLSIELDGKPVLAWSTSLLSLHKDIDFVIVATDDQKNAEKLLSGYTGSNIKFSKAGESRQETIKNAVELIPEDYEIVLIHDGARPYATTEMVDSLLSRKEEAGCVIPVLPISGAIKQIGKDSRITKNISENSYYLSQTPQLVYLKPLRFALKKYARTLNKFRDTAGLMSEFGISVLTIKGSPENIKITYPDDLKLAQKISKTKATTKTQKTKTKKKSFFQRKFDSIADSKKIQK